MLTRLKSLQSRSFFSIPGLPRIETSDCPKIGPVVSGIIATCRSALASNPLLVCFTVAVARIPDEWTPRNKGQWRILSGWGQQGQMVLLPGADNPSYSTASAWQCKCGRFSLPLYRKRKRSPFTAVLEQTSNVSSRVANLHTYSGSLPMSINTLHGS